ncbi:MAG: hypothetical protein U5L76_05445 [Patescibacteria group bacterium]|nr:hypothetical protein [Patescibacteria group bacterium]
MNNTEYKKSNLLAQMVPILFIITLGYYQCTKWGRMSLYWNSLLIGSVIGFIYSIYKAKKKSKKDFKNLLKIRRIWLSIILLIIILITLYYYNI